MKPVLILSSLNGWAEELFGSPYLYIAIGLFAILFFYALWRLVRKPKTPKSDTPKAAEAKTNDVTCTTPANTEECAHRVAEMAAKIEGKSKTILLAGAGLESLPITISVKAAIELARTGKKCILIDLDTRRNAAAKVFDIHPDHTKTPRPKPIPTLIENLSLWPAEFFVRFARMNLQHIIAPLKENYEFVLINAPYLDGHPDRKLIAASATYGLIFCHKPQQLERLTKLLEVSECKLLTPRPANQ